MSEPEQLLNAMGLADALGVTTRTICTWAQKGLPAVKLKRRRLYLLSMVRPWLAEQSWLRVQVKT